MALFSSGEVEQHRHLIAVVPALQTPKRLFCLGEIEVFSLESYKVGGNLTCQSNLGT